MFKCEALSEFSLKRFDELKNIKRANEEKKEKGMIYKGDVFECDKDIADYLNGDNSYKKSFITILEIMQEVKEEIKEEVKKEPIKIIKETKKRIKRSKK